MVTRTEGINGETGIDTLFYTKEITSKDLLYGTGNFSKLCNDLYGKRILKKEWIYIYMHVYI